MVPSLASRVPSLTTNVSRWMDGWMQTSILILLNGDFFSYWQKIFLDPFFALACRTTVCWVFHASNSVIHFLNIFFVCHRHTKWKPQAVIPESGVPRMCWQEQKDNNIPQFLANNRAPMWSPCSNIAVVSFILNRRRLNSRSIIARPQHVKTKKFKVVFYFCADFFTFLKNQDLPD